jgi:hypothetical protein
VDRLGDHFLADAAFAFDQHGNAGAGRLGGDGERGAEIGGGADDLVEGERWPIFSVSGRSSPAEAARRRVERGEQPIGAIGLTRKSVAPARIASTAVGPSRWRSASGWGERGGASRISPIRSAASAIGRGLIEQDRVEHACRPACRASRSRFRNRLRRRCASRGARQCRDESALRRFVVDQHQQALSVARHRCSIRPVWGRYGIVGKGRSSRQRR